MKSESRLDCNYLLLEAIFILAWSYVVFIGGTINGFINFKIQLLNFVLGFILFFGWAFYLLIKNKKVQTTGIEWGLLVLIVSQTIATLFSQDVRRSLSALAIYFSYALVFFILVSLVKDKRNQQLLIKTLLIVGAILIGLILYSILMEFIGWRSLVDGLAYPPAFKRRVYLVLGDANLIAAFVNILTPLVILTIVKSSSLVNRVGLTLYLAGLLIVQNFCSSRGGMLALFVEIGLLVVCWVWLVPGTLQNYSRRVWQWFRQHGVVLVFLVVIIILSGAIAAQRILNFEGDATHAPVASARSVFWRAAFNAFLSNPITGIGPGIYPSAYMLEDSMPPGRPFLHAHSIPFTFLAESGIIGVIGITVLAAVILWGAWKELRLLRSSNADAGYWIMAISIIAGAAVHGLVDNFIVYYVYGLPLLLLIAGWIGDRGDVNLRKFSPVWLIVPGILLSAFMVYSSRAALHHERGIEYGIDGEWEAAANEFEIAVGLDPHFGLYWIEGAVAHSHIFEGKSLIEAIIELNMGISKETNFSVNHANLGALYWENDQKELAIESLRQAIKLAPKAEWYWLALRKYGRAMDDIHLVESSNEELSKLNTPDAVQSQVIMAQQLISADDLDQAMEEAVNAWEENNQEPLVYMALAEVYQAKGQLDIAIQYLDAGLWVQTPHNRDKLMLLVKRAELAKSIGLLEEAQENYQAAYAAMTDTTMYGWGAKGFTPYAGFVFQRRSLPVDIVPQFPMVANDIFCSEHDECNWGK